MKPLEVIVEKLSAEIELGDEISCLQSEVIWLLEAARPKEIDALLARIKTLMGE